MFRRLLHVVKRGCGIEDGLNPYDIVPFVASDGFWLGATGNPTFANVRKWRQLSSSAR